MNADLTRFDFHALRFLKSEDVEVMTAEEVGQFVLLMCHAWLGGKNASLPNNPALLAKYVRCERVSDAVIREWTEGPDGRLYNATLSEEWDAAVSRSAHGAKAAAARWKREQSSGNTPAMPEQCPSIPLAAGGAIAKPSQSKPSQSETSRASHGVCEGLVSFWNENRGPLPEVLKITKSRRDKVAARVKADSQFPELFRRAVRKSCETPFCTGAGGRGWKANFDWLIENDTNYLAVIEGKYDTPSNGQAVKLAPIPLQPKREVPLLRAEP
jgi:uncharacterized protein YdaU (DUF1376 family)